MDPKLGGKCHAEDHDCCVQVFNKQVEEVLNGIVTKEKLYLEISKTVCAEDSIKSQQTPRLDDNNSNESQRPHSEELLQTDNQCAVCEKIFDSQQLLIIHAIDDHPNDKAFKCADCSEVFSKIGGLASHRKTHDDLSKNHVCESCSKVFKSNYHLKRHLSSHTTKRIYACPLCEKTCKNEYLLQVHQKTHFKPKSNHSCKLCSKSFISLNTLKIHLRVAHNAERVPIKTPQNHASSKSKDGLKSERAKKNICTFCSKSFLRKDMLKRHLMVHSGERPYPCSMCNKAYKDKRDLNHHLKIHSKERSKTCDKNLNISKSHEKNLLRESNNYKTKDVSMQFVDYILPHVPISLIDKEETIDGLDKKYESKNKYIYEEAKKPRAIAHLQVISISKEQTVEKCNITESQTNSNDKQFGYKCAVCDKMFNFERDFIRHVKQLHNSKAFKCRYCTASFFNARALSNHRRIHKYRNRLICGFCSKSFTCISYLKCHLEVHTVERPYTCSLCEKTYKYKRDLKKHERITHLRLNVMENCHVCKFCSKTFDRPSKLNRHIKVHTGERPFSCSLCGKSFKHNVNLTTHQNICPQSTSSLYENPIENHKMIDLEEDEYITVKCEANKESTNVESPLRFDLSNKFCQYDELSLKDNENHESFSIKDSEMIYSDNDSIDGKNILEVFKTECISTEVVHPAVERSKDATIKTKIQQKPITDNDNRINKKTTKRHGIKRQIQTNNKCAVCNKMFIFQRDLIKHAQEHHHSRKSLKCRYCKERFSNIKTLLRHSRIHNEITKKHKCEFCLKHFSSIDDLKRHLNKHYEDVDEKSFYKNTSLNKKKKSNPKIQKSAKKNYICELCSKSFPTMYRLNLHLTSHTVGRPLVCTFCEKTFKHKSNLDYHEKTHMGFEKRFTCEICSKSFRSNSMLIRHLKYHTNERPYSCFQCKKTYKHKVDLKKHQKICLQSNSCSLCEKIFADAESLKTHLKVHYINKCAICNKMCNSQRDLVKHARQFHPKGKVFQCPTCSTVLSNKRSFNMHKKICFHLKSCAYCERIMADDEFFKRHLVMHYVNKCAVCEKVCKSQKDLIIHAKKFHTNGKAFKCPVCDKLYASKTPFNCHTRTHKNQVKGDFYMYLYEKKYKQNIDLGFLKLLEENGSNTNLKPINNDNQINENQCVMESYEAEDDSMIAEYLSDYEYMVDEVSSQNDEDNAKETMSTINSLDIEILYNNTQDDDDDDDDFDAKNELDLSNTEFIDVEAVVLPVDNLEDNSEKNDTKQEQVVDKSPPPTVISPKPARLYQPIGVKRKLLADNKCAVCHKMFKFQRDLIKHAQQFHRNARAFKCQSCKARFSNKQAVSIHNRINHTSNLSKKHTCKLCSKSFTRKDDLKIHLKTHLPDPLAVKYPPAVIQITNSSDGDSKRKHICNICSKGFSNKYRLNRHLKAHTVERPYSCSVCGNNYKHEYTLREHEKTHLDFSNSKHACELCFRTFSCASRLNRHLIVHTKERPYSCSICGKAFKHMQNMKVHETKHLGLDLIERTHVCEICSMAFAAERHLKRHLGVHTGERPYACSMCEKVFKNKNGLNKHLQTHPTYELSEQDKTKVTNKSKESAVSSKRITRRSAKLPAARNEAVVERHIPSEYKCGVCDKTFNSRRDLIQHAKQFHRNAKAFKCAECGRGFVNTQALSSHTRTHIYSTNSGNDQSNAFEKPNKNIYMCEFCSKSFSCMSLLHRHFKAHKVERPYSCSVCNKTYKHLNDLKVHKKCHVRTNTCEFCFKSFARSDNLFRHLKLHDSNKCAICDKMCSSKVDLANHAKQFHPNGKVFKCQVCGDVTGSRISLHRHMANHKGTESIENPYSLSVYEKSCEEKEPNLGENDLQESTPTNIGDDIDVVGTGDNPFVSEVYETNEEIIVVDDFDYTQELFQNIEATTNAVNSQDVIEDLFIRIVTS